jgi:DNA primase
MILALDADAAGDAATKRGIDIAEREGMSIKIVRVVGGKDPDDIARENPKKWKEMLASAVDIYRFYLMSALEKYGQDDLESKKKIAEEVLPMIARITNQVVQAHYLREVAKVLEVGEEVVQREMERTKKGGKGNLTDVLKNETKQKDKPRTELLAEEVLGLLFEMTGRDIESIKKRLAGLQLEGSAGKVIDLWVETGADNPLDFIKDLPAELQEVAQNTYVKERDLSKLERDLLSAMDELETLRVRERMAWLTSEIKKAERDDDGERLNKLQLEFSSWSKKLRG